MNSFLSFRDARSADPESRAKQVIALSIPGSLAALAPRNDGEP